MGRKPERIGLGLNPLTQRLGLGGPGGAGVIVSRWVRGEVPTVCACVCVLPCSHTCIMSMCNVYSHVYTGAYYKPNAFLEESIALSRSQALVSWVLGAPGPGPGTGPSPAQSSFPSWAGPPACRTLSGGYLAALLRLPASALVESGGPAHTSRRCHCVGCSLRT